MIAIGAYDIEILQHNILAVAENNGDNVYAVFAIGCIMFYVGIAGIRVAHADCSGTDDFYAVLVFGVKHRHVGEMGMGPGNSGYHHVVSVKRRVGIVAHVAALPQHHVFAKLHFNVVFQFHARNYIAPAVRIVVVGRKSGHNNSSAPRAARSIYGKLKSACVVGETISLGAVIEYVEIFVGNEEIVWIVGEFFPVVNKERFSEGYGFAAVAQYCHEARRKVGHVGTVGAAQGNVVDFHGFRYISGGIYFFAILYVFGFYGQGVNAKFLVFRRIVLADFSRYVNERAVGLAFFYFAHAFHDRLLALKSDAVNGDAAFVCTERFKHYAGVVSLGGYIRKVEEIVVPAFVFRERESF